MQTLLSLSWLIPFAPFVGAILIWALLISFNRTMNRLTKPVSYVLIACVAISTGLSFTLLQRHITGVVLDRDVNLLSLQLHFGLYVDKLASIAASISGFVLLILMILSYFLLDRKQGYNLYFISLSLVSGSIFAFILSPNLLHRLF